MVADGPPKYKFYPPGSAPRAYDIVWCRWPVDEPNGFKDRPALVRTVRHKGDQVAVEVAYGTSQISKAYISSFYVANLSEMNEAGLYQATRFELALTLTLPWAEEFFIKRSDGKGPIIGRLPEVCIFRLQHLLKLLETARL